MLCLFAAKTRGYRRNKKQREQWFHCYTTRSVGAFRRRRAPTAHGFLGGTVAVVVERVTVGVVVVAVERAIVAGGGTGLVRSDGCCGL